MQVNALNLDFSFEEEFCLIGIHTALEDYKLAYLLNKNLQSRFFKTDELKFENEKKGACFSLYHYKEMPCKFDWYLICNRVKIENKINSFALLSSTETITYLIPEKKKVDYFIKIAKDLDTNTVTKTVEKIKQIDQVVTAYSIDKDSLKSKDFLIF